MLAPCQTHGVRALAVQGSILENLRLFAPNHVLWNGRSEKIDRLPGIHDLELHDTVETGDTEAGGARRY